MMKYVLYVNIADMPNSSAETYVKELMDTTKKDLIEAGDKLLVLRVRCGITRLEVIPNS